MFWFLLIAMVVVVAAVALAVLGGGDGGPLREAPPDRLHDPLPYDRPVDRVDIEAVRLPLALRGYRMMEVDEVLDRLAAELTERDARIEELETSLARAQAAPAGAQAPAAPARDLPEARTTGAHRWVPDAGPEPDHDQHGHHDQHNASGGQV